MSYKFSNYICNILQMAICFFISLVGISPLVGIIYSFFNIAWGNTSIILILFLSVIFTLIMYKNNMFIIRDFKFSIILIILAAFAIIIYGQYSPVLELRQDPSMYLFKAFNLVNDGYTYKSMDLLEKLYSNGLFNINNLTGYAAIQNGTKLLNYNLDHLITINH